MIMLPSLRPPTLLFGLTLVLVFRAGLSAQEENYPIPPEAQKQPDVPEGTIEGPFTWQSRIFPGTEREYWLYIPAQYDASSPCCTMVVQDGINRARGWKLPTICDNLIHSGAMPPTIGIFVSPGVTPPATDQGQPRFNRSFEYDSLGDRYARFLLEELLPAIGEKYNLSSDPNDRAIAGASSGGICAFNVAWERPDEFRRVISTIGTFVGLRGGNQLSALVRKSEPKPIRIFLQDGSSDLNIYAGDWWTANQDMLSALQWAGYEVEHVWGKGGHNGKHGAAIMPDAIRWIWQDYPNPVRAGAAADSRRRVDLLIEGADWNEISAGHQSALAPASNQDGDVFFSDIKAGRVYRIGGDKKTRIFADQSGKVLDMTFGPDDQLFAIQEGKQIVKIEQSGIQVVHADIEANCIVALPKGLYYVDPAAAEIVWCPYTQKPVKAGRLAGRVNAFTPTADHAFLHLVSASSQFTWHALRSNNGRVEHVQEYGFLEMPYASSSSTAIDAAVDESGRFYVATEVGIQVLDQLGRVNLILSLPSADAPTGLCFGGPDHNHLFVTAGGRVYSRQLNTTGRNSASDPILPPKPRL